MHSDLHSSSSRSPDHPLTIKIPSRMAAGHMPLRRSSRRRSDSGSAGPSGSEYHGSEKSLHEDPMEDEEGGEEPVQYTKTSRGRRIVKKQYAESQSEHDDGIGPDDAGNLFDDGVKVRSGNRRSQQIIDDDEEEEEHPVRRSTRHSRPRGDSFLASEDEGPAQTGTYGARRLRSRITRSNGSTQSQPPPDPKKQQADARAARHLRRQKQEEIDVYQPQNHTSPTDADGSFDEDDDAEEEDEMDLHISMNDAPQEEEEPETENGKPYALRQRQKVNYAIPPPLEEMVRPPPKNPKNARRGGLGGRSRKGPGWSASGAELGRWMGLPGAADDSDSDHPTRTPRKPFGGLGAFGGGVAGGGGGLLAGDLAAAGTPSNLGKVGDATLADADPLGVNVNVTFDEVGGLDDHINSLKEMTVLPLLYPEVFQQFKVTPPRGVLFHGPPGTGKTLLARALAASCRSNGKQISFFMRKGADALSKWVGEAERQLRLLFEEARNSQPSIIFFDEIDGLAPVRSSKQDQIHASIVSTLLALMDGMDGRGQVVVIGATNRPDAIDPALRRPGRFDREFYFPLPNLDAREKILSIMTKSWKGWGEGDSQEGKERLKGLAKLTKGYGGADLRALCTEAALNAVQRKYPQIYKSNDRLLLQPDSVQVGLRDFMISIKKIVPSSARSSSTAAAPLPPQFVPLLSNTLEEVKQVLSRVLPVEKKLTALEEAEFEDCEGEDGALEREMTLQSMEKLRIYRPRIVVHGPVGMGQGYVGAAILHHLEGYHVQSLELGSLMGDSTRTIEAAIVQLFVEAKRHQPSVIYIPSLVGWCAAVSETALSTVRAMLDTLSPTDPILLLAIVDGKYLDLPREVRAWFGLTKDNRVEVSPPTDVQRVEFFKPLLEDVRRPPNHFADGMPRKKRVLEELPIAPPPEPPKPSAAQLALQEENDQRTITLLKYRLGPILTELKRKFKRFTKRAREEYPYEFEGDEAEVIEIQPQPQPQSNGVLDVSMMDIPLTNGTITVDVNGMPATSTPPPAQPVAPPRPKLFDMDLERMHTDLYRGRYLTPEEFLDDVGKIVYNAELYAQDDQDRHYKAQAMLTATEVSIQEFDPTFKLECRRMAVRERERREEYKKSKEEKKKEKGKERAGDSGSDSGAQGIRRSARNNGLAPELKITDPLKLERRLKRQREGGGTDSHASDDEQDANRDSKRSKTVEDNDRDPLELQTPPRLSGVRFGTPTIHPLPPMQPMGPGPMPHDMSMQAGPSMQADPSNYPQSMHPLHPIYNQYQPPPSQPITHYTHAPMPSIHQPQPQFPIQQPPPQHSLHHPQHYPASSSVYPSYMMDPTSGPQEALSGWNNNHGSYHPSHSQFPPPGQLQQSSSDMAVDPPHTPSTIRSSGFDPTLLNPLPDSVQLSRPASVQAGSGSRHSSRPPTADDNPFLQRQPQLYDAGVHHSHPHLPHSQSVNMETNNPAPSDSPKDKDPTPPPVIPRTPTPLPDFYLDESLLQQLQGSLCSSTSFLTIEQLEQLRATALSCVWRHRQEWDRGALIRELQDLVNDFVAEVSMEGTLSEDDVH